MAQDGALSGLSPKRPERHSSDASLRESVEKGVVRKWDEWESLPPPLGEGSYAVVWRMRRRHKQPYAVKVLHGAVDARRLQDITHEFSILRALCEEWLPEHPWDAEECPPIVKARCHGAPVRPAPLCALPPAHAQSAPRTSGSCEHERRLLVAWRFHCAFCACARARV